MADDVQQKQMPRVPAPPQPPSSRRVLKLRLFQKIDVDGDSFLNKAEMRVLASMVGFEGTDDEWEQEYAKLCVEENVDPARGVPQDLALWLLDDQSDTGCYCTDEELKCLVASDSFSRDSGKENTSIFFAGARFDIQEARLRDHFSKAGQVKEMKLFKLTDGRSRGMGIVTYATKEEADRAISQLHQQQLDGRSITVSVHTASEKNKSSDSSQRNDSQYCGEASGQRRIGARLHGKAGGGTADWQLEWHGGGLTGGRDGKGGPNTAMYFGALQNGEGYSYAWGGSKSSQKGDPGKRGKATSAAPHRIFFSGVPSQTPLPKVRGAFEKFGEMFDLVMFHHKDGKPRGMGIAVYKNQQSGIQVMKYGTRMEGWNLFMQEAEEAQKNAEASGEYDWQDWQGYDDMWYDDRTWPEWYGGKGGKGGAEDSWNKGKGGGGGWKGRKGGHDVGKGFPDYGNEWPVDWHQIPNSRAGDFVADASRSIFFANAPPEATEAYLKQRFEAAAGPVTSLKVYMTNDGRSRGMGIVEYTNKSAARYAYSMLHGANIDGRRLLIDELESSDGNAPREYY